MKTSKPAPPTRSAARTKLPIRILIVDDHELVCSGLRLLLERIEGVTVVSTCGDCATAWRRLESLAPDLVLMDVELPDGDGIALTGVIHTAFPAVKVLVLTARPGAEVEARARAAGARGLLAKTGAAGELVEAVRIVANGGLRFGEAGRGSERAAALARTDSRPALPKREGEVLHLLLLGLRNKEIAAELKLGVKTVETYRSRLMKRFDCASPAELGRHAIRAGLVRP